MFKDFKKAAMFGLDARIALVIFTAVALISAVSMEHVVKNSHVEKLIYEIKELEKAITAYEIDTDSTLPIITTGIFNIEELKTSAKPGWKSSYIGYDTVSGVDSNRYLVHNSVGRFSLFQANDRSATAITDSPYNSCADAAKTCYLWVLFDTSSYGSLSSSYMELIDKKVDSKDGFLTGRIQKYNSTGLLFRLGVREYYP